MKISKVLSIALVFLTLTSLCDAKIAKDKDFSKRKAIILCVDGYNDPWRHAYKTPYPVKKIFNAFKRAGITDVIWQLERLRGKEVFYPTKLKSFKYNPQLRGRDWLEETLAEADKHGMKVWLMINPAYENTFTGLKGLKAQTQNYVDMIDEIGEKYGKRHKCIAGIFHHETHAGEHPDFHTGELKEFSDFCWKNFGEKYPAKTMPDLQDNNKWNNRMFIYKAQSLLNYIKILNAAARKYGWKNIFCYYPLYSLSYGVDIGEFEKHCDYLWVTATKSFYNLDNCFQDIALSYRGVNMAQQMLHSFHGKPVCIFEAQIQLFPATEHKSKVNRPRWTKKYGDVWDFYMRSKKVVDLFQGVENTKKWLDLQAVWSGGTLQAQVAFALALYPFNMKQGYTAGTNSMKFNRKPMSELKKAFPIETLLIDRKHFADYKNLKKYKMLIIPEERGLCISQQAVASIKKYLASGGKVLAVRTGISSARKDLTREKDYTNEIFGINIKKSKSVAGYHKLSSKAFNLPKKKIWGRLTSIVPNKAKILVKDKFSDKPILTQNGNAYFLALSLDNISLLEKVIEKLAPSVVSLKNNTGFSIPAVVKKNNMLCIPLACDKTASATLCIDIPKAGLTGKNFEIRNIVTGKVITTAKPAELLKGIKVKTDFDSEPFILAVGEKSQTQKFKGIYPNNKVFKGMLLEKVVLENPEVAISVPDKPGIKVGIYQNSWGSLALYKALLKDKDFNVFFLPRLDSECMANCQVIIIPQVRNYLFFKQGAKMIRNMVEKGGRGLLLTHRTAVKAQTVFPQLEISILGQIMRIKNNYLQIVASHPANGNIKAGTRFTPGFAFDHYAFKVKGFSPLTVDKAKRPSINAGSVGKGKVALYGSLPGWFGTWQEPSGHSKGKLEGPELKQLLATIKWLAKKKE